MTRKVQEVRVGPHDIAASRFAIAPLHELVALLGLLANPALAGPMTPWITRVTPAYRRIARDPAVRAVAGIWRRGAYNADFHTPPPTRPNITVAEQLAAVRATPPDLARRELARSLDGRTLPDPEARAVLESPDVVAHFATALDLAWRTLLEPDWPVLRAILDQDLLYRAGRLAAYGWAEALDDLSPRVRWRAADSVIEVHGFADGRVDLDGRGLLFVPTAFFDLAAQLEPAWPRSLFYRARGVATLWESRPGPPPEALANLLGRSRAAILAALTDPATTTWLSARLDMTLGAAGDHLRTLREAGLVTRSRTGRSVLYTRTALGHALTTHHDPSHDGGT
ncbi:DUF5937 family protein [Actinomadura kijaniata]|uniref:DNA-binding transcriptional ArsR family regulator n=1 Tax=Actinomadura namibiensis TaxID=182080 RepID=A0A7W3LYR1_ACTNM|nr:DUF5937 family protein [Actinomadura namibiensis]MBA8956702.1 DNA-binding transcriptional ArsR family regulator [Actinomadura namibiensis]